MHAPTETSTVVEFGRFRVLPHRRQLLAGNVAVTLGDRGVGGLVALIEARGAVVTKAALMERAWPGRIVEENNLAIQILALRKALAADRGLIRTVFGRGYQFAGEIRTGPDVPASAATPGATSAPSRPR